MKFDIDSARKAGYSDDEIADYLATENKFDLSGAMQSGYSARDVIDYLSAPKGGKQDLPADVTPSTAGAGRGSVNPAPVDNRGIIQRVADYLKPEAPKSVMEGYQPTAQELQADVDRRLSYGAGPISSDTAAKADLVRSGMAKTDSPVVQRTAEGMERTKAPSVGDLMQRATNPQNERAARESKAEEFRAPGEWAVDTLSNVSQGAVGLVQLPVNIIAPDSSLAQTLRDTQKDLVAQESDVLRANRERLKERVLSENGFFDRYAATVKELITNPTLSISEAAKQLPNFLGVVGAAKTAKGVFNVGMNAAEAVSPTLALGEAISGGAVRAAGQAAATHAGGAAASMVMAGGDAAGDTYEQLTDRNQTPLSVWKQNPDYQKLVAEGKTPEQAINEVATAKARMAAMMTAPLGLLGYAGAEAAVAAKGLGRATAEALTIKGAAKTAGKDWVGEQLEEGGTQFGSNVAKQSVDQRQSLTEGVPEAMGMAAVTSAPYSITGARAAYKDAVTTPPDQVVAGRIADVLIGQERADSRLINPADTIRGEEQVGPNAPARAAQTVNFTEPDSATAQAGLTPIVVPVPDAPVAINPETEREFGLDKLRMGATDVSTGSAADAKPAVGGIAGGNQLGRGVDLSGSNVTGTAGTVGGRTGEVAANAGQAVATGGAAAQPAAGVTPQQNNNADTSLQPWAGRSKIGYASEQDAEQAKATASAVLDTKETHDWRVEKMASGRYQLVPYFKESTLGNQAPQAQQAETQGQEARAGAGTAAAAGATGATTQLQGGRVPGLTPAPTAPLRDFGTFQKAVAADGIEIAPVRASEMNTQHQIASAVARVLGKTYTVARVISGDPLALSNGMVDKLGGKHIVAAENSDDAPLFVAIHEAYHGLPAAQRKALNTQLLQLFKAENKARFLQEFKYTEDQFEEEAPAFMAQVISKRADFWEDLRTKMGNREFADVAKLVLGTLNQILRKVTSQYGEDFADTYISDIVKARDLLTTAYAEAMQAQGLTADTEVDTGVMASKRREDINAKLQERVDNDFDALVKEYNALKGTQGGRLLDTDIARELSPEYREDRTRAPEVHNAASAFIDKLFTQRVTARDSGTVAFMAGGGGAGKSSAETLLSDKLAKAHTVLDGTLSSPDKAARLIGLAVANGQNAVVSYIYRDPVEAVTNGVLTRAMRTGRVVPVYSLVKTHSGASETVRMLQEAYGSDDRFKLFVVDNSRGPGNAAIVDLSSITPVIKSGLKERLYEATQQAYDDGRISRAVYDATVAEGQPDTRAEAQTEARAAADVQGDRASVQGRGGSERAGNPVTRSTRRGAEAIGEFEVRTMKDGSIVVYGDSDSIRAQIPEDVKGRVTKDGIVFTTSAAPRVKAALEGRKTAYSRGGAVLEKLPMKDGKYVGAPAKFDTPGKIPTLRKWLRQLADEGAPGRYWYENSSREVLKMVGGNVQEARKFVALLAIYSPQAKVDANSTFALRAWAQYKAGQPISVKTGVMDTKAQHALDDVDAFWSGEKTGNFFFNLLREIDPSTQGKQGATIDMWMMRAGQYDTDAPTATQYAFMENETNRLAAELGWEPQQVQAAIWVAMKARMENTGVKKATEASSEKKGWLHYEYPLKNGRPFKTRKVDNEKAHRDNWLKHAFAHDPSTDDTQQAKFDFGDGLKRHIGQISFEARPGRSTGVLPGIHSAPYAQQVEFQQAVQKAFYDEQGNDLLAMKLGLLVDTGDILLPGVWQGEVSPSSQKLVAMAPAKGDAGKSNVDPAQAKALNVYASVAGLVTKQEGVGWHRPFYAGTKRDANGLDIDLGRAINPAEAADLEKAIGQWMADNGKDGWQDQFALISSPTGIRVVNFGIITNGILHSAIVKVAEGVLPDFEYRVFASDGDMPSNNWKENPNGESYVQGIGAAGRSDVLDWARDFLAPRVHRVFTDFSERYGWGDPGTVQFSRRGDGGRGQGSGGTQDRTLQAPERAVPQEALSALPGAPQVKGFTGPDPRLVSVAEQYARDNGITLRRQAEYVPVDETRARRIATAYALMRHDPQNPRVKEAYQNLIRQTRAQYDALADAGYKFWFVDMSRDDNVDYVSTPWNAMRDIRANKEMGVFPTADGFGTNEAFDPSQNPLLEDTGLRWPVGSADSEQTAPVLANDLFRAVHDAFGHGLEGSGFRAQGEENAWQAHVRLFTGSAVGAITSETRGQNSWLNYGPHGEKNRTAKVEDTVFADQKTGLMPEWTWTEGRAGDMPEMMRSARAAQPKTDKQLEQIFTDLQGARGLRLVRANERVDEHPMADTIKYVNANFYDILEKLDDAGLIQINCK